jgi:GNAT superfamily N-acetyltransferase
MAIASENQSAELYECHRGEFLLSTDRSRLDLKKIHGFLTRCYWANGIPKETVARSIEHSLCFGMYNTETEVGFARVISDYATFAYLGDVFVLEPYRGQGLGKWMLQCIMAHPCLQGLRRWTLLTRDAHALYAQFGFTPVKAPERYMEIHNPRVYSATAVQE